MKKKIVKIPKFVHLIYSDGVIKHYIDTPDDLEAVKLIADNDGYKIKYPKAEKDWTYKCCL